MNAPLEASYPVLYCLGLHEGSRLQVEPIPV